MLKKVNVRFVFVALAMAVFTLLLAGSAAAQQVTYNLCPE